MKQVKPEVIGYTHVNDAGFRFYGVMPLSTVEYISSMFSSKLKFRPVYKRG